MVEEVSNWLAFSQSFLLNAKLGCQELEDKRDNKHRKITRFDPPEFNLTYQPRDLYVPIIFNIKHGLEIFIKTLVIFQTGSYRPGHDLKKLFDQLKLVFPQNITPLADRSGDIIEQADIDAVPNMLDELEGLVYKYYQCEFVSVENKKINVNDKENNVFRYPKNKAGMVVNLESVDEKSIKQVHEDIDKIYRILNDLGYLIDVYASKIKAQ
ncbi:MAG: hypothetical protein Q7S23_03595 [bacterium]|nr:hypothetical protein [bacterium]